MLPWRSTDHLWPTEPVPSSPASHFHQGFTLAPPRPCERSGDGGGDLGCHSHTGKTGHGPCWWHQILALMMIPVVIQGKLCSHGFLSVAATGMRRREGLRPFLLLSPAHPAVPMDESVLSLSFTFLSAYMDFCSWTRACGKDFRGGGSLVFHQ